MSNIVSNIPLPSKRAGKAGRPGNTYPVENLKSSGDSFWVSVENLATPGNAASAARMSIKAKGLDFKIVTRTEYKDGERGLRIWRL